MATTEEKYFHDRLVLILISFSVFLTALGSLLVLLRIDSGRSEGYIVQYRSNLGVSAFKTGSASELLAFVVFALVVLVFNVVLSYRVYRLNKSYSVAVLGLGLIPLALSIFVGNALLVLR